MSGDKKETAGELKMKVLGITGGVGAGKSTVLGYLAKRYGARVIEADRVAHLLQQPGGDCYDAARKLLWQGNPVSGWKDQP